MGSQWYPPNLSRKIFPEQVGVWALVNSGWMNEGEIPCLTFPARREP